MTSEIIYPTYHDVYEYHGNTAVVQTRVQGDRTLWRDWILFDSVEEANDYFHSNCAAGEV